MATQKKKEQLTLEDGIILKNIYIITPTLAQMEYLDWFIWTPEARNVYCMFKNRYTDLELEKKTKHLIESCKFCQRHIGKLPQSPLE